MLLPKRVYYSVGLQVNLQFNTQYKLKAYYSLLCVPLSTLWLAKLNTMSPMIDWIFGTAHFTLSSMPPSPRRPISVTSLLLSPSLIVFSSKSNAAFPSSPTDPPSLQCKPHFILPLKYPLLLQVNFLAIAEYFPQIVESTLIISSLTFQESKPPCVRQIQATLPSSTSNLNQAISALRHCFYSQAILECSHFLINIGMRLNVFLPP